MTLAPAPDAFPARAESITLYPDKHRAHQAAVLSSWLNCSELPSTTWGRGKVRMRNSPHSYTRAPTHVCILMFVDTMEIERFPVNEELVLCDSHSADPHGESVEVRHQPSCRLYSQLHLQSQALA